MEHKLDSISLTVQKLKEITKSMPAKRPAIVIPTIRDGQVFRGFYKEWEQHFAGCNVIIIEDRNERVVFTGEQVGTDFYPNKPDNVWVFTWKDIDEVMGENAWIIPRGSDCVRSFGYLVAQASNPRFILTLDDDVFPIGNPVTEHYKVLETFIEQDASAFNTLIDKKPRGLLNSDGVFPEISHGAWYNVPDYDAETHAKNYGETVSEKDFYRGIVPKGSYAPLCGMNLAWKPFATRYLYFTLQGKDKDGVPYGIDRCGDNWAGYMAQHADMTVVTGYAPVNHNKLSNVWVNMCKEDLASYYTYEFVELLNMSKNEYKVGSYYSKEMGEYFIKLFEAYKVWISIVDRIDGDNDELTTLANIDHILSHLNKVKEKWEISEDRLYKKITYQVIGKSEHEN